MTCIKSRDLPAAPVGNRDWPWNENGQDPSPLDPECASWPKISVITPSFNQGKFIEETIRSVLLQNYPNLEFIVIDGGSQDETLSIIRKYSPWITCWISEPDSGQTEAINKGFRIATGDLMGWLNSDDTYTPGALWRVARYFREHSETNLVYGEAWVVNEIGFRLRPCRYIKETFSKYELLNTDPIVQPATFWTRQLWLSIGELDTRFTWGFDWEYFIRANQQTAMCYIPEYLANIRWHSQNKTFTGGAARHAELARITRLHGRWWYPNNLMYQAIRPWYWIKKHTATWPAAITRPLSLIYLIPRFVALHLFGGKFMN
jgi:glycosyltransferase involved in cell wall biosynthesis